MREILRGENKKEEAELRQELAESRDAIVKLKNEKKALEDKVVSLLRMLGNGKNEIAASKTEDIVQQILEEKKEVVKELDELPKTIPEEIKSTQEDSKGNINQDDTKSAFVKYRAEVTNVKSSKDKAGFKEIVNFYTTLWKNKALQ